VSSPHIDSQLLQEIGEHIASGVVIYVATRDAKLQPESVVAMGARSDCTRRLVTVYLPQVPARATLKNLETCPDIAVTFTRPVDHKSLQLKGKVVRVAPADEAGRALQGVHRAALTEQFAQVGVPRSITRRLSCSPSVAVDIEVSDAFLQTPGPRAGEPLRRS
jgi:hypothetical protein